MPLQPKRIANENCADMMSAKSFINTQNDPTRLQKAQTYVTKEGHPQNRSMISNYGRQNADNDPGTQSMLAAAKTGRDVS